MGCLTDFKNQSGHVVNVIKCFYVFSRWGYIYLPVYKWAPIFTYFQGKEELITTIRFIHLLLNYEQSKISFWTTKK